MAWFTLAYFVVSAVGSYLGSKSQTDALDAASAQQTELQKEYLQVYKDLMAEGAFERGVASASRIKALQALGDEVKREVGTSPEFLRAAKKGMEALTKSYATSGLVSGGAGSSDYQKATGEFMGELTARDYSLKRNTLLQLAGLGTPATTPTQALSAFKGYGDASTNLSNIELAKGRVKGDLYKDIGNIAGSGLSRIDYNQLGDWFSKDKLDPNGTTEGRA